MDLKKEYYIDCCFSPYDNKIITEAQYNIVENASHNIYTLLNEIDYFPLILLNLKEFNNYCETTLQNGNDDFINLNRLFANFVNSFYMWITYHERNYTDIFVTQKLKSKFFDTDFQYRLAYNLRTFTAHKTKPITIREFDVLNQSVNLYINVSDLIDKSSGIQDIFRKELISNVNMKKIDVLKFAKEFAPSFEKWQRTFWNELKSHIDENLLAIHNIIPITSPWFVNAYFHSPKEESPIPLGHQLKYLSDKSQLVGYDFLECLRKVKRGNNE